jgi:hypothetical protein
MNQAEIEQGHNRPSCSLLTSGCARSGAHGALDEFPLRSQVKLRTVILLLDARGGARDDG